MMTMIIMIAMFMPFVPTTMAEAEEVLGMFEEVMIVITSTEVASKAFIIQNKNNNQERSKDIFMNEDEDVEEEVSSFDSLSLLLNNNNESSPMTTRPSWGWFTKDVLRRTKGRTQLDEEDYDVDEEGAETERKNRNRGSQSQSQRRKSGRGGRHGGAYAGKALSQDARAHVHTFHFFFMCPVASEGSNSLVAVSLEGR